MQIMSIIYGSICPERLTTLGIKEIQTMVSFV